MQKKLIKKTLLKIIILPPIPCLLLIINKTISIQICSKLKIPFNLSLTTISIGLGYEIIIILLTLQILLIGKIIVKK